MNNDDRSDRDVCRRRRRRGAYAAVLGAAVGAALATAMIPAPPAYADTTDDAIGAAAAADASDYLKQSEEVILNNDITTVDDDLGLQSLASPDVQFTDELLSLLPGGGTGTDGVEVETLLVTDIYTPLIDLLGGGGMMSF